MNVEDQEKLLEEYNKKIKKINDRIKTWIPTNRLKIYFYKRLAKHQAVRNELFRNIRDHRIRKEPHKFITNGNN